MARRFQSKKLYKPTDEQRRQVLMMTGFGIIQDDIATSLNITKPTLHKHFRRELDTGMIEANVRVAKALYENATRHNNTTAQIWWTKARMGWKGTDVLENVNQQPFAIFVPTPIDGTNEWLRQHAPANVLIEHETTNDRQDE